MARKGLVSTAVISMLAGEFFLMHRNIHDHRIDWPVAFALWLTFGIAAAFAGDAIYNRQLASGRAPTPRRRLALLLGIAAAIFASAWMFAAFVFLAF